MARINKKSGVTKLSWGFPNFNGGTPWGLIGFFPNFRGAREWGQILGSVRGGWCQLEWNSGHFKATVFMHWFLKFFICCFSCMGLGLCRCLFGILFPPVAWIIWVLLYAVQTEFGFGYFQNYCNRGHFVSYPSVCDSKIRSDRLKAWLFRHLYRR